MSKTILVCDDEKNIREGLGIALELDNYQVLLAENGQVAWSLINKNDVDLVISDLRMEKMGGEELLKKIVAAYPNIPVFILTGHGTIETAVNAMRDGAVDFFTKPVDLDRLSLMVKKSLKNKDLLDENIKIKEELAALKAKNKYTKMIGTSSKMKDLMETIAQVATSKASVLVTGESGVGKELVADAIHQLSPRRNGPFIKVHCAALTESLLESELFGHEKGSFTGANATKKGRFELADGGTIFLDEIGDINLSTQIKILRVLQERQFERVGGEKTLTVDVRVVTATNKDLQKEIENGNFREDLFYRLNVVHLTVPPLRERKDDLSLLITSFLTQINEENGRSIKGFTERAKNAIFNYDWPGNIRELRNCVESAIVLTHNEFIDIEDLPEQVRKLSERPAIVIEIGTTLAESEKQLILGTLSYWKGNKTKSAEVLGIGRKTMHRKIEEYSKELE
ncbi:MAG: sigma-54-dependent Fis family transcriptional regulator [Spirochaetaceae bacterium]|nr:sigma-54-dependent Fis family transcriptional regulator [Spirochaetaceae bacterium]